jgi:hypothetical protein
LEGKINVNKPTIIIYTNNEEGYLLVKLKWGNVEAHFAIAKRKGLRTQVTRQILVGLMLILSTSIFVFYIYNSWINTNSSANFADMISGEAQKPYVTRVLVPWLTRGISALMPEYIHTAAENLATRNVLLGSFLMAYRTPADFALEAIISLLLQLASIVGFAFTFRGLYRKVFKTPELVPEMFTLVVLLGITPMLFYGYIYDFPSLLISTLGLYCIASKRKVCYFLVFTLATLNKETAIFLAGPAILLFWDWLRPSLRKVAYGILAQAGIYLGLRIPIGWIYHNNSGGMVENHLAEHAIILRDFPIVSVLTFLIAMVMIWLAFNRWRDKPVMVMFGVFPGIVLLPMFLFGGYPFEIRVFYDVYAASFMSMIYTLLLPRIKLPVQWLTTQDWLNSLAAMISRMTTLPNRQISQKHLFGPK